MRETNIWRLIGVGLVLIGGLYPMTDSDLWGGKTSTNLIQVLGVGIFAVPLLREFLIKFKK